ncbi:hypothetical protein [Mesorhizobium sp.]|uniref:hypothetical protein n=1 Tax=Mesorhizobium sp. TaxID=1871066 RepID=UPI0025C263D7|nr:hypothetical protein [Mesorhizobium sp.]
MKFRLVDKDGKETVHDGVMARLKPAQSVTWGDRAFVRTAIEDDTAIYREVDNFRIGR